MPETGDIRIPILTIAVAHEHIANPQIHHRAAEEKIEITEGVEIAQNLDPFEQSLIIRSQHHLGAA